VKKNALILIFFLLLTIGVWFGDGIQSSIDTVMTLGVLCIVFILPWIAQKQRSMNQWLLGSGTALLIFLGIHIFFSDDIAISFSMWMRYITGTLVFWIFYSYTEKKHLKLFVHALCIFGLYILFAWICFPILPHIWTQYLPKFHLLQSTSGHYLTSIPLVFTFAPSFLLWIKKRKRIYGIISFCLFIGSLCTFARATILIELGIACSIVFLYGLKQKIRRPVWIFMILIASVSIVTLWFTFSAQGTQFLGRFQSKQSNPAISRIWYWNQAFKAIADKPLLGHGLGTFFIQSTRFQSMPMTQSWFAHNSILELLSDMGFIGALPVIGFILALCIHIVKQRKNLKTGRLYGEALMIGILSLFLYSCIEYPFHFFVIFLLLLASIGVLAGTSEKTQQPYSWEKWIIGGVCGILMLGMFIQFVDTLLYQYHRIPCPYLRYNTIQSCLMHKKYTTLPSAMYLQQVKRLHVHNPIVLYALGWQYEDVQKEQLAALQYFNAFLYDPFNPYITYRYLTSVLLTSNDLIGQALTFIGCHRYPNGMCQQIKQLDLSDIKNRPTYREIFTLDSTRTVFQDYPLILYKLGLFVLPTDPLRTKALWETIKDLWPTYAPFWAELSSLEQYNFHNPDQARMILINCLQYKDAQKECEMRLQEEISLPGSLSDPITKWWQYTIPN